MPIARLILQMKVMTAFPATKKNYCTMAFIIMILCVFGWLGQALKDGADVK